MAFRLRVRESPSNYLSVDGRLAMLALFGRGRGIAPKPPDFKFHFNRPIPRFPPQVRDQGPTTGFTTEVFPVLSASVHKLLAAAALASSSEPLVCLERSADFFINVDRKSPWRHTSHLPTWRRFIQQQNN